MIWRLTCLVGIRKKGAFELTLIKAEYYLRDPVMKQEYGRVGEGEKMSLFAGALKRKGYDVHMWVKAAGNGLQTLLLRQVCSFEMTLPQHDSKGFMVRW